MCVNGKKEPKKKNVAKEASCIIYKARSIKKGGITRCTQ